MFGSFFKRRVRLRAYLPGGIDAHCHLIPGVDDGAATLDESLAIINRQIRLGLCGAICTPHIMARYPQNTPDFLRKAFRQMVSELQEKDHAVRPYQTSPLPPDEVPPTRVGPMLETFACPERIPTEPEGEGPRHPHTVLRTSEGSFVLYLAAEYMLDEMFPRHLESGDLLYIEHSWFNQPPPPAVFPAEEAAAAEARAKRKYILVELPQYLLPPGWQDMLDAIFAAGYTPMLAHPERYHRLFRPLDLCALAERGIAFQGNLGSYAGIYGNRTRSMASVLDRFYTIHGTDAHSINIMRFFHVPVK